MSLMQFAQKWLNAWSGNRPDALLELYHPDAFYSDPAKRGGLKGHLQIRPYFIKLLGMNPNWQWEVVELFITEKGFVLKWKATIPVGIVTIEETGLDIVEMEDGLIKRNEVFFDRLNWMKALPH